MKRKEMLRNRKMKKPLKEYFRSYYNGNFMRDYRYIPDDKKRFNEVFNAKKIGRNGEADLRALHFLTKSDHLGYDGLLGGEITYFKTVDEYRMGNISHRWADRLFFDIDIEDARVDIIKDAMKEAYAKYEGPELENRLDELKQDFRDLIFGSDLLKPTFQEAKKLCLYLEGLGLKPYLIFSGAKGYHCNLFFDEVKLQNLSQVSRLFAKTFSEKLNLKYLDWAVFDRKKAQRRLQRCQYVFHSKTDLTTIPIPEVYDYDEMLETIGKNSRRPIEFDFQKYSSPSGTFRESLIYNDNQFTKINARQQREKKKANTERKREMMKKYGRNYKDYSDISMIDLFTAYGGEVIKEDSGKAVVRCLFHGADRNPSAVIFKDSNYFHCSSCGKTLNYYSFIAEMEGTSDHSEIMAKVEEFMK